MRTGNEILSQTFYSRIPNSPAYSMGQRKKEYIFADTPGPGKYTPIVPFRQSPRAIMSGSKDSFYKVTDSPGPGRYEQLSYTPQGIKFTQEKRQTTNYTESPGPGKYDQVYKFFAPAYIMPKAQRKQRTNSHIIGPGCYNIPSLLRADIGFKMPRGSRKQKIEKLPGPGEYYIKDKKTKGIKIGTSPRLDKSSDKIGPGPADYSPRLNTETSPRAVIGTSQRGDQQKQKSPGPGEYELPQSRSVSFSFPKQNLQLSKPSTPFSYINDYTSLKKTSISFGKAQKNNNKAEIIPGPGQYEIEGFFRRRVKTRDGQIQ